VKLFAGILEEVWMQAKKVSDEDIRYSLGADFQLPAQRETEPIIHKIMPKFSEPIAPIKSESSISPSYKPKNVESFNEKPQLEKITQMKTRPSIEVPKQIPSDLEGESILGQFTEVINNLDKKFGNEISADIEKIRNKIEEEKGYSSVLGQMNITIASLNLLPNLLSNAEIEETKKKIEFWISKLNIT
ncbi:MAG: hypothetical protein ACFFCI_25560, partial [Promethearchaeota archaeon]